MSRCSSCLSNTAIAGSCAGAPNASLFRANLLQLGIRFSGEVRAELRQIFGPLWHSHCRVRDGQDMERLEIRDARSE